MSCGVTQTVEPCVRAGVSSDNRLSRFIRRLEPGLSFARAGFGKAQATARMSCSSRANSVRDWALSRSGLFDQTFVSRRKYFYGGINIRVVRKENKKAIQDQ
jgi:hypothetical protein